MFSLFRQRLIAIVFATSWVSGANAQEFSIKENVIWDTANQKTVSENQLLDVLAQSRTIILGETHGDAEHQNREAFLINRLADRGQYPSIALEMVPKAKTSMIQAYRQQSPEEASLLGEALDWVNSGWPDYSFYEPVINAAFRAKDDIVGLDMGETEKLTARNAPVPANTPAGLIASWRETMAAAHCNLISPEDLEAVTRMQVARDRSMTVLIAENDPVLAIVGAEHARKDRGSPALLAANGRSSITLALMSYTTQTADEFQKNKHFDYIWFTPGGQKAGTCERLRSKGLIR